VKFVLHARAGQVIGNGGVVPRLALDGAIDAGKKIGVGVELPRSDSIAVMAGPIPAVGRKGISFSSGRSGGSQW
jgi:hypothetical protein